MLDHVERWRFLVQPPRKNPLPRLVSPLHVDLDKGSGQLFLFPRRGRFAGAQADDHVLPAHRLTGVKRDILNNAIALVEDAEDSNPLGHRRYAGLVGAGRYSGIGDDRLRRIALVAATARREQEGQQHRCSEPGHAYSGIQGS